MKRTQGNLNASGDASGNDRNVMTRMVEDSATGASATSSTNSRRAVRSLQMGESSTASGSGGTPRFVIHDEETFLDTIHDGAAPGAALTTPAVLQGTFLDTIHDGAAPGAAFTTPAVLQGPDAPAGGALGGPGVQAAALGLGTQNLTNIAGTYFRPESNPIGLGIQFNEGIISILTWPGIHEPIVNTQLQTLGFTRNQPTMTFQNLQTSMALNTVQNLEIPMVDATQPQEFLQLFITALEMSAFQAPDRILPVPTLTETLAVNKCQMQISDLLPDKREGALKYSAKVLIVRNCHLDPDLYPEMTNFPALKNYAGQTLIIIADKPTSEIPTISQHLCFNQWVRRFNNECECFPQEQGWNTATIAKDSDTSIRPRAIFWIEQKKFMQNLNLPVMTTKVTEEMVKKYIFDTYNDKARMGLLKRSTPYQQTPPPTPPHPQHQPFTPPTNPGMQ
eukprot:CAMPEP_0113693376 /NCGR_PEP_ID=MMETSP0038_2-20120614/19627_1 /TAXON_ID=2898 /ORGANISM="Cryptomonas paramecium" /LENGTH=448 /DNA_ID=CAMNT_0000615435 /DNA_START=202 /DNA_END=1548 /DNA_ORIENTATION=+ /assembly_acc=CAM_ASM_000170